AGRACANMNIDTDRPLAPAAPGVASMAKPLTEAPSRDPELGRISGLSEVALRHLFDRLPHGLALVDRAGAIRAADHALSDLLGLAPPAAAAGTPCRAALGCRAAAAGHPATGCGGACVVTRALDDGETVVDMPVMLRDGGAATVTAVPLDDG